MMGLHLEHKRRIGGTDRFPLMELVERDEAGKQVTRYAIEGTSSAFETREAAEAALQDIERIDPQAP